MITTLTLQHFRNYSKQEFEFTSPITLITGENGKGKTNILEAVSALSFIKPFRSGKKEVFVEHGSDFARICGETDDCETLEIFWGVNTGDSLRLQRNGLTVNSKEYLKQKGVRAVVFSPEDLNLPILSPQYRRDFLSRILSSLFPEYFSAALQYKSILKQRNALLKKYADGIAKKSEFSFWDDQLVHQYSIISGFHFQFFEFVNQVMPEAYQKISGKDEDLNISPKYSFDPQKEYSQVLQSSFDKDVFRGSTSYGTHRDDFSLLLRDIPLEEGASRGETRSALLAFKKAEQLFIEEHTNTLPVLLLDDVFSELDHAHQTHLLSSLSPSQQCIITTTELEIDLPKGLEVQRIEL